MPLVVKNLPANAGDIRNVSSVPGSGRSLEEEMATHSRTLAWRIHGQRSLAGYSPRGHEESDLAHTHRYSEPPMAPSRVDRDCSRLSRRPPAPSRTWTWPHSSWRPSGLQGTGGSEEETPQPSLPHLPPTELGVVIS